MVQDKIKSLLVVLFVFCGLSLTGCKKETTGDSRVRFATSAQMIPADSLVPVTFNLDIHPPAPESSYILIDVSSYGGETGTAFSTAPALSGDKIALQVAAGDRSAAFTINPIAEGIGFNSVFIDLEIIDTGEGLSAGGLTGVYSSLSVINDKDQARSLPFTENFDDCDQSDGLGSIPAGWEEIVAQQNALGTGHWLCSSSSTGVECNAYAEDGTKGDNCEVWLLTPVIDLTGATSPVLSFDVDRRFETADFQEYDVQISTNYRGRNLDAADWSVFTPAVQGIEANDPGADDYETVGNLDLSAFVGEQITIAFIYYAKGSRSDATILRIDQLTIKEEVFD